MAAVLSTAAQPRAFTGLRWEIPKVKVRYGHPFVGAMGMQACEGLASAGQAQQ